MPLTTIGTDSIDALAITTAKLAADSVTAPKIATNAVDSSEIAADAVTTTEIVDNAVTGAKIALTSDVAGDVMYYNGTDYVRLAIGTAAQALKVNSGATAPEWGSGTTTTINTNADNRLISGSDTANTLNGEANLTYDGTTVGIKNAGTASDIKLYCESSNAHYVSIKSPAHADFAGGNWTLTLPGIDGVANEFLQTNGSGVTSWADPLPIQTANAGKRLTTDATTAKWSDQDGKNIVINGGMDVWQRGVSFASASYYQWYADRWNGDAHNSSEFTVTQITGATVAAAGATPFSSALRFQRNASSTEVNNRRIGTVFETAMSRGLAGKMVTLSFYARQGANGSISNTVYSYIFIGTGVNETTSSGLGSGWTGYVAQNQGNTITTSWVRFTQTVTLSASTNQLGIQFTAQAAAGTAGADDTWDISGIKLEVGSEATPFFDENPGQEMAACQRYFEKSYNLTTVPGTAGVQGGLQYSTNNAVILTQSPGAVFKVTKRTTPTIVVYNAVSGVSGETYRASDASSQTTTLSHIGEAAIGYLNVPSSNNGYLYHYTADSEL